MDRNDPIFAGWTDEQYARTKRLIEIWKTTGPELERIRREELRNLDRAKAILLLCADHDYTIPPRAPKPTSGLIEQQYWFKKLAGHD